MPSELPSAQLVKDEDVQFVNSLQGLCGTLYGQPDIYGPAMGNLSGLSPQISSVNTLFNNNRWYLISNLRQLLSEMYVEHGIIQTLIDQPVDDAFRAGFEIKTSQLDEDEKEKLLVFCERNQVIAAVMQAIKWSRLYGGGAVLIITDQDPMTPLNLNAIGPDTPIEFRSVDMWELYYDVQNTAGDLTPGTALGADLGDWFDYYGKKVHKSRVYKIEGKQAPSFVRPRLRGWGMSELERIVRSLNQYMKNQDVIFELLDEAKIDVYKIKGFNTALMNKGGTQHISQRIQLGNMIKNYNHALTMDAEDDYAQKEITFTGLADVLTQIRQGIAADLKMPMTKLFGISAAGFSSGEDDLENYNSMIEGEIRSKNKFTVVDILMIACQHEFGFMPEDMQIIWNPLRMLNAKEEEEVKDSQFARLTSAYTLGLASGKETKEALNKDSLLGVEVDENAEALPPPMAGMEGNEDSPEPAKAKGGAGKTAPKVA
jgi:uncharacterized protein